MWRFAVSLLNLFYQPVKLVLCEGFLTACKLSGIGHLNSQTMRRLVREDMTNNLDAQIHPDTHILTVKKLWLVLTQQSIHDNFSTYYCLKKNNRCVESLYVNEGVVKCDKRFHKFTLYTHILTVKNCDLSWLNNLFMISH